MSNGSDLQLRRSRPSFAPEDDSETEFVLPDLIPRPSKPISISRCNISPVDSTKHVHKSSPVQQHVNQIYFPYQQHDFGYYCGQTLQVSVVDPRLVPVYQQVHPPSSPQPIKRLTPQTLHYGQPRPIQQSQPITPQEYSIQRSLSTTPTDQQQYWEVSCSDTQSVSSVGSLCPSGMSTSLYPALYNDQNIGNQPMISPLSTHSYTSSQAITPKVVPSLNMSPLYPTYAQGYPIPSYINHNINQITKMTTPSWIQRQAQLNLEKASASTQISITPPQKTKTKTRVSLTTKARVYKKNFSYTEETHGKHSNLYVNWAGKMAQLRHKLELQSIEVHTIQKTAIKDLWNVVFDSHSGARRAFTSQREIKIRMVPPRGSKKKWFRNPGPKFLVQYETKCRLDIRGGKAVVHNLVGTLLMSTSSSQGYTGCHIWADQIKGNRIRIVGCVGKFMLPCKKVINMKEIPPMPVGNTPFGWVSYKSRTTREEFVTRISGNLLEDYIYNGSADLQCTKRR